MDEQELERLLNRVEPGLRDRFLEIIKAAKDSIDLAILAALLTEGRYGEALALVEGVGRVLAAETTKVFLLAGEETAAFLTDALEIIVAFDQTNDFAIQVMQRAKLDLISEFTRQQTEATRAAILEGFRLGLNPRDQAILFRDSIGLTAAQQRMVENFRRLLENDPRQALLRELRDGRFDQTIEAALRRGEPLTRAQVEKMVARYRENFLAFRAETIARTEALAAVHGGSFEMFRQAVANGEINPEEMFRTWHTARDARVRDSHVAMEGQRHPGLEPFTSGLGNRLRFPGDPLAPIEDRIQCRCVVTNRLNLLSLASGVAKGAPRAL